jgi:septal ring factor EnvC (AmiA/AmiB activator)
LRLQDSLRGALIVLGAGVGLTLLLTLANRLYPLGWPLQLGLAGLGLTSLALVGSQLYFWLRPRSPLVTARRIDQRLGLDERVATALHLARRPGDTPPRLIARQLTDTVAQLESFQAGQAFPLDRPWHGLAVCATLLVALAVNLILPNPTLEVLQREARAQDAIAHQQEKFEEIRADLLADELLLDTPQGEALVQTLDDLIQSLAENNLDLEAALAEISSAEQELAQLQNAAAQAEETLAELAQTLSRFDSTATLAEALKQRRLTEAAAALQQSGEQAAANPDQAQALAEALRQAADSAQQAGDSGLAEALNEAAEALEQQASQGGQNRGDNQAMQQALDQAAEALQQAGEQLAGQEAVEQALANIQEAREQLAEADGQEGQGQGQGQAQAEGQGQGTNPQGVPLPGAGGGSGREDPSGQPAQGLTAEQGTSNEMSTGNGPNEGRTREYESLYAPDHLGGEGGPLVKPDEQGAQEGLPIGGEAPVDPSRAAGEARVPYNQVYSEYNDAASQALDESYIPLGMKGYVRQYFGALEPEN